MDEPLFAVEEKFNVDRMEGPSTGSLTSKKPSEVNAMQPIKRPVKERRIVPKAAGIHSATDKSGNFLQPICKDCGKAFFGWLQFLKHRDVFRNKPHFFCDLCNVTVALDRSEEHQKSLSHSVLATSTVVKFEPEMAPKKVEPPDEVKDKPLRSIEQVTTSRRGRKRKYQTSRIFPFIRISARALEARKEAEVKNESRICTSNSDLSANLWERAAGATNAEDILLETNHKGEVSLTNIFETEDVKPEFAHSECGNGESGMKEVKLEQESSFDLEVGGISNDPGVSMKITHSEEPSEAAPIAGPWMCPIEDCLLGFDAFSSLETHMLLQHQDQPPIWCQLCPKTYRTPSAYVEHMRQHKEAPIEKNNCEDCGKVFETTSDLWAHLEKFERLPHFHCKLCDMTLPIVERRVHLMSKSHRIGTNTWNPHPDPCPECGKTFRWSAHRQHHLEKYKRIPHFFCEPCNLVVHQADNLYHDLSKSHQAKAGIPAVAKGHFMKACEECGKVFYQKANIDRHYDVFKEYPHFYCEPCKMHVKKEEEAKHGRTRRHLVVTGAAKALRNRWKCPINECGVSFPYKRELDDHMSAHPK